jgi:cytochrome c oxidase subunit I
VGVAAPEREFRTCAATGFEIERSGQRLTLANAVAGITVLALAGLFALLVALQRFDIVPISDQWWYRLVAAHGTTALIFWMFFFEVALLYWGSTMLLNAPMRMPRLGWTAFGMMVVGVLLAEYAMLTDPQPVMFTAYPPLETTPIYYLGVLLFAVGVVVAVVLFFANVVGAKRDGYYRGSLPLVTFGIATAAIIAVYSLGTGAVAYGLVFLQSLGVLESVDPAMYRLLFWGIGHGAQQINLAAMVAVWYGLAGLTVGARAVNEGLSRFAFLLLLAFIHLGAVHHLMVDPGLGSAHRLTNTSYLLYLAVLASLIHAFSIPAAVEVGQRQRRIGEGLFGWLRKAPWKEPGFSALVLSLVLFGFFAGVTGVLMGQMQLNMLIHNTLFVPGHFHGTVVAGTTLAFMGISYYMIPLLTRRQLASVRMARWQPYVFGGGVTILMLAMTRAGFLGVPRRVADLSYSASPLPTGLYEEGPVVLTMAAVAVGAVLAVTGGVMFVWVIVNTLLRGKLGDRPDVGLELVYAGDPARLGTGLGVPLPNGDGHTRAGGSKWWGRLEAPGTFVLVLVFLVWFVAMYLLSHVNLSRIWPVG